MNWDRIEGNWRQFSGQARSQWGELTDDQIVATGGRREDLIGKIQEAYGIARDAAERQVREWSERLQDADLAGRFDSMRDSAASRLSDVREAAGDWTASATDRLRSQSDRLSQGVGNRPLTAVAIAFVGGLLVGLIAGRPPAEVRSYAARRLGDRWFR